MSRGIGALQRKVIDALDDRADRDSYDTTGLEDLVWPLTGVARARWRWYTLDLLDLTRAGAPRSERVSLHRAVHGLHRRGLLEVDTMCPYGYWYGIYQDDDEDYLGFSAGTFSLDELSAVDSRWPSGPGRSLWFRLPAPNFAEEPYPPDDDQMSILAFMPETPDVGYSEPFMEFTETTDRPAAWATDAGRFIRWLFCGPLPGT